MGGFWLIPYWNGDAVNKKYQSPYGTSVSVYAGGKVFKREVQGGGSGATASQNTSWLHFGLGDITKIDSVNVVYNGKSLTRKLEQEFYINWIYKINKIDDSDSLAISRDYYPTPSLVSPRNTKIVTSAEIELKWNVSGDFPFFEFEYNRVQIAYDSVFSTLR